VTSGWVINLWDDSRTEEVDRAQPPVIYLPDTAEPVFEVWFWHAEIRVWFVMSRSFNVHLQRAGVVYFDPNLDGWKDRLREIIRALGGSDADGADGPL